jgi:hypothetical protein
MTELWLPEDSNDPRVAAIFNDVLPEGWEIWVFLDSEHGQPIVHEIRIAPTRVGTSYRKAPEGGIKTRYRGLLNFDELRLRAFYVVVENASKLRERPQWQRDIAAWRTIEAVERELGGAQSPGRRRRTPELYVQVAASYLRNARRSRRVYAAMHETDFPFYHEDTLRDLVKVCRSKGYLTAAPKGRAGGQLTDRALRMLGPSESDGGADE